MQNVNRATRLLCLLAIAVLILAALAECKGRGGGGGRGGGRGGSRGGSRGRGGSGGRGRGSSHHTSSYPRQSWSSKTSYTNSGWSYPRTTSYGWSHDKKSFAYGGSSYKKPVYGRYYGGSSVSGYFSPTGYKAGKGLFGGAGGKKAFAVGAGAGFVGGAVAAGAAMSVYHRYIMYKSMMSYRGWGYGGYGGYGYGYGYNREGSRLALYSTPCVGGCPSDAFCDYGICRCKQGYEARFGQCYRNFGSVFDER